jgi:hypothetical protein
VTAAEAVSAHKANTSLAEIVLASVCMFAAETDAENALADWLDAVGACDASPTVALGLSGCESDDLRLVGVLSGRFGIGCGSEPCDIIARACNLIYPDGEWSGSLVIKYQKLVNKRQCPAMHHGGPGEQTPQGARMLTVGAAKQVARFIGQNRNEIALALHSAREGEGGGGGGGSSSSSPSAAQRAQKAVTAAARAKQVKKQKVVEGRTSNKGSASFGKPSASEKATQRAAAEAEAAVLASGSPSSQRQSFAKLLNRPTMKKLNLSINDNTTGGVHTQVAQQYLTESALHNKGAAKALLSQLASQLAWDDVQAVFAPLCKVQCGDAGNAMTSGVGHTVRSNGFGRAIWDVRLSVPNKVHRHPRIDQGFRSRHRAVHLASRVAQGAVWRGKLHFWIHVEVGGESELGLRVGGQIMCRS